MKRTGFYCMDSDGNRVRWYFWHDGRRPASWMLEDHEGYVRVLENTWVDSAYRIKNIAENYGFTTTLS